MPTHVRLLANLRLQTDLRAFAIYWKSIVTGRLIEASDSKIVNTKDMDSNPKPHKTAEQVVEKI